LINEFKKEVAWGWKRCDAKACRRSLYIEGSGKVGIGMGGRKGSITSLCWFSAICNCYHWWRHRRISPMSSFLLHMISTSFQIQGCILLLLEGCMIK